MCDCTNCGNFKEKDEKIEVGDVVRKCSNSGCIVLSISSAGRHALWYEKGSCACVDVSDDLTLIRKGVKRHITEMKSVEQAFLESIGRLHTALKMWGQDGR